MPRLAKRNELRYRRLSHFLPLKNDKIFCVGEIFFISSYLKVYCSSVLVRLFVILTSHYCPSIRMASIATVGDAGTIAFPPHLLCISIFSMSSGLTVFGVTVARIAYASSDVVLSVQPALGADSEFSSQLHLLASKRTPGIIAEVPKVGCPLRSN